MVRISQFESTAPSSNLTVPREAAVPFDSPIVGGIQRIESKLDRRRLLDAGTRAMEASAVFVERTEEAFTQARNDAPLGQFDAAAFLRDTIDPIRDEIAQGLEDEDARRNFEESALRQRTRLSTRAGQFSSLSSGQAAQARTETARDAWANSVMSNPDLYATAVAEMTEAWEGADAVLPADSVSAIVDEGLSMLAAARVVGEINIDPAMALETLNSGELDNVLDPGRKSALLNTARVRQAQNERQSEIALAQDVEDAIAVLGAGKVPPNLPDVVESVEGTELADPLALAIQSREAVQAFSVLPLANQAASLRNFALQEEATREQIALNDRLTKAHSGIVTAVRNGEAMTAAQTFDIIGPLAPVALDDPDSLRARAVQAEVVSGWVGVPVSPFTAIETTGLVAMLEGAATPGEVTGMLGTLHTSLGHDQALTLAGGLSGDRPEIATAIAMAGDDPNTARDIVLGGRLLRDNSDVRPSPVERHPQIEAVVGNMFEGLPESATALSAFTDAAAALYAARRVPTGDLTYDSDTYEQALRDVMGGPVEINGRTILPPVPGMDEDAVEDLVEGLTLDRLIEFGNGVPSFLDGSALPADAFSRGLFFADAQLVSSGFGRYMISLGGRFMLAAEPTRHESGQGVTVGAPGGAYELDLRSMVR